MILRNSSRNRFLNPVVPTSTRPFGPSQYRGVPITYGQTRNLAPAETAGRGITIDPSQIGQGGLPGTIAHEYTHYTQQYTRPQNPLQWAANLNPRLVAGTASGLEASLAVAQAAMYSLLPGGPRPFELGGQTGAINTLNEMMPWGRAPGVGLGRVLQPLIYPNLPSEQQVRREVNVSRIPSKPIRPREILAPVIKKYMDRSRRTRTPTVGGSRAY